MVELILLIISVLNVPKVTESPIIDGNIEAAWSAAESLNITNQWVPNEGQAASESTKVYICCDGNNLFVAFRCFAKTVDVRVVPRDGDENGDHVWFSLDTYLDKSTGYQFFVNAANCQIDCRVLQDGRAFDSQWDGVWFSATKLTDYGYNVEIKVPFKTLRFKTNLGIWGVNFLRYITEKNETDSWAPLKRAEGERMSRSDTISITPGKQGLHLEIYPVGIVRYDQTNSIKISPQAGLDAGWAFTSSQLSVTAFPDFAQIEADPYEINLSKYEICFEERRPFFLESQDMFSTPIQLFYSRRIGTKLEGGGEIPIMGGAKYTGTQGRVRFGALSAFTDSLSNADAGEPRTLYSAGRVSVGIFENSEIGMLYAEERDSSGVNSAMGLDLTLRNKEIQVMSQIAKADTGFAEYMNLGWYTKKFLISGNVKNFDSNFDANHTGYEPYPKYRTYYLSGGPRVYNWRAFYSLTPSAGAGWSKERDDPEGYWGTASLAATFKNNADASIVVTEGRAYDMGKSYNYYEPSLDIGSDDRRVLSGGIEWWYKNYGYNYRRGYFGPTAGSEFKIECRPNPMLKFEVKIKYTYEWNEENELEPVSWVARPVVDYSATKDLHLVAYTELAQDKLEPEKNRMLNLLISYNFRPKSWLYVAWNETRTEDMILQERIAVVKLRYLFFM